MMCRAGASGPGAPSRPGRQGDPGWDEPGPGSHPRQADVRRIPGRPDLDGTQKVQIRSTAKRPPTRHDADLRVTRGSSHVSHERGS